MVKRTWYDRTKPYLQTASSVASTAAKLASLATTVYKLKSLINTEFKTVDTVASSVITTTPIIAIINALATGDDFDDRDGRVVRFKSIDVRLEMTMNTTPINDMIRVMVVIDKQANETTLLILDLLTLADMRSHKNLDQRKRFVILKDEVIEFSVGKGTNKLFHWYKKLDMKTIYDSGNAGTIADITTNAMYLILFGTEAANGVLVSRSVRMRYIDN